MAAARKPMRIGFGFRSLVFLITAAAAWGAASTSQAGMQLRITEVGTGNSVTIDWDGSSTDPDGNAEIFERSLNVGDFNVYMTVVTSNAPGTDQAWLGVGSTSITNLSGTEHTLTIEASATGYTNPGPSGSASLPYLTLMNSASGSLSSNSATTSASGSFTSYASASDTLFAKDYGSPSVDFAIGRGTSAASYSGTTAVGGVVGSSFSLTSVGSYTLSGGAKLHIAGGDTFLHAPEPATLLPAVGGMVLLGIGRWYRGRPGRTS
jgi:hypothetical protein